LAAKRPRWGYRPLHIRLQRKLGRINHKRVQRLYQLKGFATRHRKRKRVDRTRQGAHV
jgi:putative transposase